MIILTILIALILQITLLDLLAIGWIRPNLLLIVTVFYAIQGDSWRGFKIGLLSGILADLFSAGTMGVNTIALGLCGYLAGYFARMVYKESVFTQVAMCIACGFVYFLVQFLNLALFHEAVNLPTIFFTVTLPAVIFTACAYPLVSKAL